MGHWPGLQLSRGVMNSFLFLQLLIAAAEGGQLSSSETTLPSNARGMPVKPHHVGLATIDGGEVRVHSSGKQTTCAGAWEQCGGQTWSGNTCCTSGYICTKDNEWYSQCKPTGSVTPTTAPSTTSLPSGGCAGAWGQCGGGGWSGTKCCVAGYACTYDNSWFSQCKPSASTTTILTSSTSRSTSQTATTTPRTSSSLLTSVPSTTTTTVTKSTTVTSVGSTSSVSRTTTRLASTATTTKLASTTTTKLASTTTTKLASTTTSTPAICPLPEGLAAISQNYDSRGFVSRHGKLRLSGAQLVDEAGNPVQLRGLSTHGLQWVAGCYTRESLSFLAQSWGITLFRAAMYIGEGGFATNPSVFNRVKDIVDWCEELGIYVIVDWHVLTPGDPNYWLTGAGRVQADANAFWNSTAMMYRSKKHVIYEIANEPNGVPWSTAKSYANSILRTIRAVDNQTLVIVGTSSWSSDINLAAADPVSLPYNVMYAFHLYAGSHMDKLPMVRQYASKIPIFVSEWGTSSYTGNGGPFLENAKTFLDMLADSTQLGGVTVSWALWTFSDVDESSAALKPSSCGSQLWDRVSCTGLFIRSYLRFHGWSGLAAQLLQVAEAPARARLQAATASLLQETCAAAYQQCGGRGWQGATCCLPAHVCEQVDSWYSQCRPGVAPMVSSTLATTPSSVATTSPAAATTSPPAATTSSPAATTRRRRRTTTVASDVATPTTTRTISTTASATTTVSTSTTSGIQTSTRRTRTTTSASTPSRTTSEPVAPAPGPLRNNCVLPSGLVGTGLVVNNLGFATRHGKLRLSGVQLVDKDGFPVQLRGVSSHGVHWFPNCYTKESLQFLVERWGITLFRAAMYVAEGGYATDKDVLDTVENIVSWCEELGIYVIIDWHILTPGDPNYWLTGAGRGQADAAVFWKDIATKYASKDHVLYEICNEPNGVEWPAVKSYADAIIDVIRAADPETIVIVGSPEWSQQIDRAAANPVARPYNVMYTFHFYAGTHMFLLPRLRRYIPHVPVFVTEWGTSDSSGDGGPYLDNAKQFLDLLGGQVGVLVSWAQWSYSDKSEGSALLAHSDWPTTCGSKQWDTVSCSGGFLRSYLQQPVPDSATATSTTSAAPSPLPDGCTLPTGLPVGTVANSSLGFAGRHGKLRLLGAQLVDKDGLAVQLRGVSSHGLHWFPTCYTRDSLQFLVEHWGITLFRAAMYVGEGGYSTDKTILGMVEDIVSWCEELGIYVIIDWHVLTPGDPNYWLSGAGRGQADASVFWSDIATKYATKNHVLYEICNEPNGLEWPAVKSYADAIIDVIRAADPETIVIVGSPEWSQQIDRAAANPVARPYNVMYTFHFYAGTHMFLLPRLREHIPTLPIFVTEWGTSDASGNGGPYLDNAKLFLDLLGGQLGVTVSWAQWSYADKSEASALLLAAPWPGTCSAQQWDAVSCSGGFTRSYLTIPMPTTGHQSSPHDIGSRRRRRTITARTTTTVNLAE